jgi:ABC-type multidrug transport system fused ATPase/permease subunit
MSENNPLLKDRRNWRYALIVLVVLLLALLVMEFNNRTSELYQLEEQRRLVGERYAEQQNTQQALLTAIAFATQDRAVDQWAREFGAMSQEDDHVVKLIPSGATPTPTPRPIPKKPEKSNLERWLELFFGTSEP